LFGFLTSHLENPDGMPNQRTDRIDWLFFGLALSWAAMVFVFDVVGFVSQYGWDSIIA